MGILGKLASAPLRGYRFIQLYGQHLPRAFDAVFSMSCRVTILQGCLRGRDDRVTVLYVGRDVNYHYLLRSIFEEYREIESRAAKLFTVRRHMKEMSGSADVTLLDLGWPYNNVFLRNGGWLQVPDWVNMAIEFPAEWDDVVRSFRRTARKHDMRLIRRNNYRCEVGRTREDVETFYDRMYVPFVSRRHAEESVIDPRKHVIRQGLKGSLLHVVRGDEIVAAGIVFPEDDIMFSLWMGVPEPCLESRPEAAISALYLFGIRHAFDEGYRYFDFTGTRAFLKDGAYQFKRRWGPRLDDAFSPGSILIKPRNGSRNAALFCQQVPVLHRTADGLAALFVCVEGGPVDEKTFARLDKDFSCGGIDRITVIEVSDENETKSTPNSGDECQYRLIRTTLDKFAECYVDL